MNTNKIQNEVKFSNDLFFKYILSRDNEKSLKLRKQVIKLIFGIQCKEAVVKNPEINQSHVNQKSIILDINIEDEKGHIYDIELQMVSNDSTYKRFQLYGDRLAMEQLGDGEDYYGVNDVLQGILINADGEYLIQNFKSRDEYGNIERENIHHRTYINMKRIDKILETKSKEELSDVERLCYLFIKNSYDGIIKDEEDDIIRQVVEMYNEFKDNEGMYSMASQREIAQRVESSYRREYFDKGLEHGIAQGLEQGIVQGLEQGLVQGRAEELIKSCFKIIKNIYQVECLEWLHSLDVNQLEKVQDLSFEIKDFNELKQIIEAMK